VPRGVGRNATQRILSLGVFHCHLAVFLALEDAHHAVVPDGDHRGGIGTPGDLRRGEVGAFRELGLGRDSVVWLEGDEPFAEGGGVPAVWTGGGGCFS
jgi:hypothetical protein